VFALTLVRWRYNLRAVFLSHFPQDSTMANPNITFDHIHLISKNPTQAAQWYVDKFGADVVRSAEVHGAPQVYLALGDGAMFIVRGERPGESTADKCSLEWGVDHFGVKVTGDFAAFCAGLKAKGVAFSVEPRDNGPTTQLAFITAPDGAALPQGISLVHRCEFP
jgi:catechol 2,3-dioxygenase-like lactoylglutathione lyase family enzyme